jgi:hypothetical protein
MTDLPIPPLVLDASGVVGAWTYDHRAGRLTLLGALVNLLGFDPAEAAAGVPLPAILDRMHPDDRGRLESFFHAAAAAGYPVESEFRIHDTPEGSRTLLLRGRIEGDAKGQPTQGCGIAIDRTESHATDATHPEQIVNRMAEQVITLRGLARALDRPALADRIDCLMIEIGFELARFLPSPDEEARH